MIRQIDCLCSKTMILTCLKTLSSKIRHHISQAALNALCIKGVYHKAKTTITYHLKNILIRHISLSTIVLNSRNRGEIIWLHEFLHYKQQT